MTTGEGADLETKVSRLPRPTVIAAVATLLLFAVIAAFAFEPFVEVPGWPQGERARARCQGARKSTSVGAESG